MQLLENKYEKTLLLQLSPKARDVAEGLLNSLSLAELLSMWQKNTPDEALLNKHQVPHKEWYAILNATILAKTTYFLANPRFTKAEIFYLIKAACGSAGHSLTKHSLKEAIQLSQPNFPVLHEWLLEYSILLKTAR